MPTHRESLLCRYHYDPLDRLTDCTPTAQASSQRFYLKDRLATEIQGARQRSILQHEDQLLAQQQRQSDTVETQLLATDQQRSVLAILDATRPHHLAYTPYGHRIPENGLLSLLGFNGERPDPVTGHYLLGNGYRAFNPVLMRFNSPDSWSPFGEGGLNAYGYCAGHPVIQSDPTGHTPRWVKAILRPLRIMRKKASTVSNEISNASGPLPRTSSVDGSKTPAWTSQHQRPFSAAETPATVTTSNTTIEANLTASSTSPDASPQPYVRRRRNANVYDATTSQGVRNLIPRFQSTGSISSTSSRESISNNIGPAHDPSLPRQGNSDQNLPTNVQAVLNDHRPLVKQKNIREDS